MTGIVQKDFWTERSCTGLRDWLTERVEERRNPTTEASNADK